MTPELETCLNYCDHGEGGEGNPYLPTLHGMIVNAVSAETVELEQQVKNLEEYMLKGVAFRDELQAALDALKWPHSGHIVARIGYEDVELTRLREENARLIERDETWRAKKEMLENDLGKAWEEAKTYKRLLDEQVDATNVVTKELNACYAALGIFRHPNEPDRGPDMIASLTNERDAARGAVEWAITQGPTSRVCRDDHMAFRWDLWENELRRRAGGG